MTDSTGNPEKFLMSEECTIYEVAQLKEQILELIEKNKDIEFDLSNVSLLDASVVQLLIASKLEMEQQGLKFSLKELSSRAKEFIENIYCDEFLVTPQNT